MKKLLIVVVCVSFIAPWGAIANAQFGPPPGGDFGSGGPGSMMSPPSGGSFGPPSGGQMMGPGGQGGFGPGGGDTCNINGTEVPGKCKDLEQGKNMMGPGGQNGGQGGFGSGGPGGGQMMGPGGPEGNMPDEAQMEEMQKKQMKMQLTGMLRGIKQGMKGMGQGMKMMKSALVKLEKQGIATPTELKEALAKADEMIAYINGIKSADDIADQDAFMDKMSDMRDVGDVMQEWGPKIGDLFRIASMIKEADRRMKQIDKDVKRAKAQAAKSKVDLSDIIAELDNKVNASREAFNAAKSATDVDEKQTSLEAFFESMQDIYDTIRVIDSMKNLTKAKTDWARQIKLNDQVIKQLQRKKLDVEELLSTQSELKTKYNELVATLAQKPIDQDAIVDLLEEGKTLQAQFIDAKDQLLGQESEIPQLQYEKFSGPKMDFGAFQQFKKTPAAAESDNGGEGGENIEE